MTFWSLTNSDFPTNQTFHQFHDIYTYLDLHRLWVVSMEHLQRVWHASRERLPFRTKRIVHGVMVRIGKVEPEGWPVRSGPSFSEVQIIGLPEGSTFPILTNDPVIDFFLAYQLLMIIWRRNSTFSTCLRRMTLCCYAALLRYVAKPEVVHALRCQSELLACVLCW